LNLHALRHYHLKVARLPISPPGLISFQYTAPPPALSRETGVVYSTGHGELNFCAASDRIRYEWYFEDRHLW
jgi:hypothetical protein